uniref:Amino acid permease N-terminal domain-containing protein n=1 Tax=Timema monikensis TaxID=170555 RepID=A0A7R9HKG7_9NEOP|nr:unnamed protein product [Timema monikensis]
MLVGPCQLNKTVPCAIERKVFGKMSSEKYTKTDDRRDSWGVELDSLDKRTRFQVNRVDAATSKDCEEGSPLRDGEDDDGRGSRRESVDDTSGYDTRYAKSFRHFTREALPRADNYRNIMSIQAAYRPTLDELHNETIQVKLSSSLVRVIKLGYTSGVWCGEFRSRLDPRSNSIELAHQRLTTSRGSRKTAKLTPLFSISLNSHTISQTPNFETSELRKLTSHDRIASGFYSPASHRARQGLPVE